MKKLLLILLTTSFLISCKNDGKKTFSVSGEIINNKGKMAYLEEVPVGTMRAVLVDSAKIGSNGGFSFKTETGESSIYNIRIDNGMYPIAAVVNDAASVKLKITMSKENPEYSEKYEVTGSPASQLMQEFTTNFNNKMKVIFDKAGALDSLQKAIAPDSIINETHQAMAKQSAELKEYAQAEMNKSNNVALTMFILGYYQSTANNPGFGLEPLGNDQVNAIIDKAIKDNPDHTGMAQLKQAIAAQTSGAAAQGGGGMWVGKQAPDFTLPDVNGKPLALSSLKGKYVLVDFWASWCKPCRMENPNVVAAFIKFKNKNFTILGVSLDEDRESWLSAIKKDQLSWQHVSDLKQWESMVLPIYQFDGIPYNVLVDPQGKVIAESLRGPALEAKLAEVLN